MGPKPVFGTTLEVYRARLAAVEDWDRVAELLDSSLDPVAAIQSHLGVGDLAARAVVAMAGRPLPTPDELRSQLRVLEQINDDLAR